MLKLKQYLCNHDYVCVAEHKHTQQNLHQCTKCEVYFTFHYGTGASYKTNEPDLSDWKYINESEEKEMNELQLTDYQIDLLEGHVEGTEYTVIGEKSTVACLTMNNGYEVIGTSACVNPKHFNEDIGRHYALVDALNKLDELVGVLRQEQEHKRELVQGSSDKPKLTDGSRVMTIPPLKKSQEEPKTLEQHSIEMDKIRQEQYVHSENVSQLMAAMEMYHRTDDRESYEKACIKLNELLNID